MKQDFFCFDLVCLIVFLGGGGGGVVEGEKGFLFGLICYYHTRGPTVMYPDIEQ